MKNRQLCAFDMRVDDLDDQGWAFLYLLPDAQMRRATAQQWACSPMCEVCSTAHPGHPGHPYASPAAVSCNHQGRPIFSAGRPGRPGAGSRIPARVCPRSSPQEQALPEVVLSIVRSYAWATNRRGDRRSADHVAASSTGASPFALTSAPAPRHATISVAKTSLW